jgi:hypothetical protein
MGISDVAFAPSDDKIIYLATGDHEQSFPGRLNGYPGFSYGVLKSTDGGVTWTQTALSHPPQNQAVLARLWVHPTDPNTVIVASYAGLRKTTNGGASWVLTDNLRAYKDIVSIPGEPSTVIATTFSPAGTVSIMRSSNAGETWTAVQTITKANRIRVAVTPANANVVWAVASNVVTDGLDGVYRSVDKGVTWTKLNVNKNLLGWSTDGLDQGGQGMYDLAMAVSPLNAQHVVVGGINIWRTSDNANTWTLASHSNGTAAPYVHSDHHHLVYQVGANRLWTVHDGGIGVSTDNGVSWSDRSRGLRIQQYHGLATSNILTNLTIAGAQDNATTIYDGSQWNHVIGGDGTKTGIDPVDPNTMYASIGGGRVFKSTNAGVSFTEIANRTICGDEEAAWVAPFQIDPTNPAVLYHGRKNLWKSTNRGMTWSRITTGVSDGVITSIRVAPSNPDFIYIIYSNRAVYISEDGGSKWRFRLPHGVYFTDIEVDPTDHYHYWLVSGGFFTGKVLELGLWFSGDISAGLPNVPVNCVYYQKGVSNRLYVGTDIGVFYREPTMRQFEPYGTGGPQTIVTEISFVAATQKIRVSTFGRGLWEVDATQCAARTPNITVTGPPSACTGDTVTLTVDEGYLEYLWSNGYTGRIVTFTSNLHSGKYRVAVKDSNGCRAFSDTLTLLINGKPWKPRIIQLGQDTLVCTNNEVTVYRWYINDSLIQGQTSRRFIATQSGSYRVEAVNTAGCSTISDPFEFTLTTSVEEEVIRTGSIVLSPNPVTDQLTIGLPGEGMRTVQIVSVDGRIVAQFTTDQVTSQIGTSEWASGAYVVRVSAGAATWSRMLMKD